MKPNKKSKDKTERSSSSSSSNSDSNNSTSSSNGSRISGSKNCETTSKKRKALNTSSKDYKHNHSLTRATDDDISKKKEDYPKYKKPRNDRSNYDYHSHEGHDDNKKEKYKRDVEPTSSKHSEDHSKRKKESAEKIRDENDRYNKKRRDKEPSRYDHYDRSRGYHKSANARERTREGEERKFTSTEGSRSNNHYTDNNSRGIKYSRNRRERSRSRSFNHANAQWGKSDQNSVKKEKGKPTEKQKPNFGLSGKLTEETNTYRGVVIKYSEPPEARKPKRRWRLYPFKGEKALQTLYIHRESAYLIGRDRKVVDLPVDHPSCSKQHAVLQYRLVSFIRDDGTTGKRVRPYIIDLESANGTYINNKKIDPKKYVELLEKDVIKFGFSSREYVLLHENSKDEAQDDDVKQEEEELKIKDEKEN